MKGIRKNFWWVVAAVALQIGVLVISHAVIQSKRADREMNIARGISGCWQDVGTGTSMTLDATHESDGWRVRPLGLVLEDDRLYRKYEDEEELHFAGVVMSDGTLLHYSDRRREITLVKMHPGSC